MLGQRRGSLARLIVNHLLAAVAAFALLLAGASAASASSIPPPGAADSAGTNIGNAAQLTSTVTGTIVNGSDDWWVIYPATAGKSVTVNVTDNAAPGTNCANIFASLDGTNGSSDSVASETLEPAGSGALTGSAPGSNRYFVEVSPSGCASIAGYTLTLTAGGGGTAPTPKKVSVVPGTSIGSAWPPLLGHTYDTATLGTVSNDDWYTLYKKSDTTSATIRIQSDTVSGAACGNFQVYLDGTAGSAGNISSNTIFDNGALTLTIPGKESGDPQGRYYIEIAPNPFSNGCGPGASYSIEPEPATQWSNPTKVASGPVTPGTSIGSAWPPLAGGIASTQTLGTVSNDDWYTLYKKPDTTSATIRIQSTNPAGGACANFEVYLDGTDGSGGIISSNTVFDNNALTLSVPGSESGDPQGRYYLEITPDPFSNGCGPGAGYSIEPEPAAEWTSPAQVPSSAAAPGTTLGNVSAPLPGGISHTQTLGTVSNDDWYVLYKKPDTASGTIRITNTTVAGSACGNFLLNLDRSDGSSANISSVVLSGNTATTYSVPGTETGDPQGRYYVEVTTDPFNGGCGAGASYSIEPEPAAEWSTPAALSTAPMPSGPTLKAAGGPLAGNTRYNGSLGTSTATDWVYFHVNGSQPVTARVEDTTESDNNCLNENFVLQNSSGTTLNSGQLGGNSAANTVLTAAGNYFVELTVAGSCVPVKPLTADINLTPGGGVSHPGLTVSNTTLPNATVGKAYSATIAVTGGKSPYTFTAESALPAGLKLNSTTGVISGTPTKTDTFTFAVKIVDSTTPIANAITDQFTITIK